MITGLTPSSASFLSNRPHEGLALFLVGLHRLLVDQPVELGVAVFDVVSFRAAGVVLVEILIGIVDAVAGEIECDGKIFSVEAREPLRRVHRLEFVVDIDLLQLVDQNDRRVAEERQIAVITLIAKRLLGPYTAGYFWSSLLN